jgi:hypothetical protein
VRSIPNPISSPAFTVSKSAVLVRSSNPAGLAASSDREAESHATATRKIPTSSRPDATDQLRARSAESSARRSSVRADMVTPRDCVLLRGRFGMLTAEPCAGLGLTKPSAVPNVKTAETSPATRRRRDMTDPRSRVPGLGRPLQFASAQDPPTRPRRFNIAHRFRVTVSLRTRHVEAFMIRLFVVQRHGPNRGLRIPSSKGFNRGQEPLTRRPTREITSSG